MNGLTDIVRNNEQIKVETMRDIVLDRLVENIVSKLTINWNDGMAGAKKHHDDLYKEYHRELKVLNDVELLDRYAELVTEQLIYNRR